MTIFVGAVWNFSLVLLSYILEPAEVIHIIFPVYVQFCQNQNKYVSKIVNKRR